MKIVIDTNILMSALIKDSATRKIILESDSVFYYPREAFNELERYEGLILEKSKMSKEEYAQILILLLNHIKIVPKTFIGDYFNEAKDIMQQIDPDDVIFIATALAYNATVWSDDIDFQKQDKIKVLTTRDMLRIQRDL